MTSGLGRGVRFMIKRSIASVLDQAMLSGLNFSAGIYLISNVPKGAYGLYVQLFAVGVLFCGVIDALIAHALTNLSSRRSPDVMALKIVMAQSIARLMAVLLALLGGGLALGLQWEAADQTERWRVALAFAAYVCTLAFRDFKRVLLYLDQCPFEVLKLDGVFVVLAVLGGLGLHVIDHASLESIFVLLAFANTTAVAVTPKATRLSGFRWTAVMETWREFWGITRWALPGLAMGWMGNSLYLYVAGFQLGLEATAELNASRLLLMPVTLLTVAWQQMARSDVAKLIMHGRCNAFGSFLIKSAIVILIPMVLYLGVLYFAYHPVSELISAGKYIHFSELLIVWIVYFLIYSIKFVGTVLIVGFGDFLALFKMNVLSLTLQLILLVMLTPVFGVVSVIFCLIASELFEAIVIWVYLFPRRLRSMSMGGKLKIE